MDKTIYRRFWGMIWRGCFRMRNKLRVAMGLKPCPLIDDILREICPSKTRPMIWVGTKAGGDQDGG